MKHRGSIVAHSRILGLAIASTLAVATLAGCASEPDSSFEAVPTIADSVDSSQASIATDPPVVSGRVVAGGLVTEDLGIAPAGEVLKNVRVERVVDGDTFKAVVDGELVSVRIIGIDTPER